MHHLISISNFNSSQPYPRVHLIVTTWENLEEIVRKFVVMQDFFEQQFNYKVTSVVLTSKVGHRQQLRDTVFRLNAFLDLMHWLERSGLIFCYRGHVDRSPTNEATIT